MASIIWNNLKGLKDKSEAFFGGAFCFALDWKFWRYHETQKDAIKALLNFAEKLNLNLLFIINLWTCFFGNYFMMMVFIIFPEFPDRLISIIMNYEILTLELIRGQIWPLWYIFSRIHLFLIGFLTRFHFLKHAYFLRMSIHIQSKGFWSYFSGKFFFDRFKPDYTSSIEFNSPYKLNEGAIKGIYINIISEYYFWNFTKNVLLKILFLFIWERSSQFSSQN